MAVQEINAAGGIDGRQIELITRDTQSDPTKAVNGAAELTRGQKVSVVFGPVNSGESLAVVPLLARTNTPQVHPCWVDTLTDPKKYPMCFRNAPTNQQIGGAANRYVVEVLKRKKVAVISDTTGYGTASVNAYVPMLKAHGRRRRLPGQRRRRQSGPQARAVAHAVGGRRSDHALERECRLPVTHHQYARADGMGRADRRPDHARLRPDQGPAGKARILGEGLSQQFPRRFATPRAASFPDRTSAFVDRLKSAKIDMGDTLLWWIALGYDSPRMIAEAMKNVGTEPEQIVGYLNKLKEFPGVYGDIAFTADKHDGYPDDEVVMVEANSLKDGAFNLAPGYGA